jgi:putative component of toxin-antitoxin plasmid stabilization module
MEQIRIMSGLKVRLKEDLHIESRDGFGDWSTSLLIPGMSEGVVDDFVTLKNGTVMIEVDFGDGHRWYLNSQRLIFGELA